jgi:hypothetical protein
VWLLQGTAASVASVDWVALPVEIIELILEHLELPMLARLSTGARLCQQVYMKCLAREQERLLQLGLDMYGEKCLASVAALVTRYIRGG